MLLKSNFKVVFDITSFDRECLFTTRNKQTFDEDFELAYRTEEVDLDGDENLIYNRSLYDQAKDRIKSVFNLCSIDIKSIYPITEFETIN